MLNVWSEKKLEERNKPRVEEDDGPLFPKASKFFDSIHESKLLNKIQSAVNKTNEIVGGSFSERDTEWARLRNKQDQDMKQVLKVNSSFFFLSFCFYYSHF